MCIFVIFDTYNAQRVECGLCQGNIQKYKLINVIRYFKDHCTKGMSKDNFYRVEVIDEP